MIKAGQMLRDWCPAFIHVTCLCHLLHLAAEKVRFEFTKANLFIR